MIKRSYTFLVFLTALFSVISVPECSAQAQPEKPISTLELKQILKAEDENAIIRAMNRVKQNQESHDLIIFVMKLWANDKQEYPDLPWRVVNSESVRIEVANVLAQASNNGLVKINREDLRKYAKQVIAGSNEGAKATAVNTLGLIKNSADLELLKNIALEEKPRTFWTAIIALSQSCDPRANVILEDIKKRVSHDESKKFLRESSSSLSSYKYGCEKH